MIFPEISCQGMFLSDGTAESNTFPKRSMWYLMLGYEVKTTTHVQGMLPGGYPQNPQL